LYDGKRSVSIGEVEVSRVVEAVAADRAAVSQPAADGVVVDRSAVVDVVVEAL